MTEDQKDTYILLLQVLISELSKRVTNGRTMAIQEFEESLDCNKI